MKTNKLSAIFAILLALCLLLIACQPEDEPSNDKVERPLVDPSGGSLDEKPDSQPDQGGDPESDDIQQDDTQEDDTQEDDTQEDDTQEDATPRPDDAYTEGLDIRINDLGTGYRIVGYTGSEQVVTIPGQYLGLPVTEIAMRAFRKCETVTKVIILEGVTLIDADAFRGCANLREVVLPSTLRTVAQTAFDSCDALEYHKIGTEKYLGTADNACFALISTTDAAITSLELPEGTRLVGSYALADCRVLSEVILPEGLKVIGEGAFSGCWNLKSITLPRKLVRLDDSAFSGSGLVTVTIPGRVEKIGSNAFSNCKSLKDVVISDGVKTIGAHAFSDCSALQSVVIPDSVTEVGYSAFLRCLKLQVASYDNAYYLGNEQNPYLILLRARDQQIPSLQIAPQTKIIYDEAMYSCRKLTEVRIPEGVITIGKNAFGECNSLETVSIPDSVTKIGDRAFSHCYSLLGVMIPQNVNHIGEYAFAYCRSLKMAIFNNTAGWETPAGEQLDVTDKVKNVQYLTDEIYMQGALKRTEAQE